MIIYLRILDYYLSYKLIVTVTILTENSLAPDWMQDSNIARKTETKTISVSKPYKPTKYLNPEKGFENQESSHIPSSTFHADLARMDLDWQSIFLIQISFLFFFRVFFVLISLCEFDRHIPISAHAHFVSFARIRSRSLVHMGRDYTILTQDADSPR